MQTLRLLMAVMWYDIKKKKTVNEPVNLYLL